MFAWAKKKVSEHRELLVTVGFLIVLYLFLFRAHGEMSRKREMKVTGADNADFLEERGDSRACIIRRCPLLLPPWEWVTSIGEQLVAELHREICPTHSLCGKKVNALAQNGDDVLFLIHGEKSLALVHLTWARSQETDPRWPSTGFFAGWQDWFERCLKPEHEEYRQRMEE